MRTLPSAAGLIVIASFFCFAPSLFAFSDQDIASYQREINAKPPGERIALWAEKFVGVPYDPDPLGEYVTKRAIVADDHVDCMYLTFRAVELAMSKTPEEAVRVALDKRFIDKGIVDNGLVLNYEDRFQYGEDMIDSGKWGREITADVGPVSFIPGTRGREKVAMVSRQALLGQLKENKRQPFRSGDVVFFIKSPEKRVFDEVVGHIGIVKVEGGTPYLIHASGRKQNGGEVRKVLLSDYLSSMPFAGIRVSRFPFPNT